MNNFDFIPNRKQLDAFLNRPLTRRQFLTRIGTMAAAVFGIATMLNNLQSFGNSNPPAGRTAAKNSNNNGSYGGKS